jgi:hypothetical protein
MNFNPFHSHSEGGGGDRRGYRGKRLYDYTSELDKKTKEEIRKKLKDLELGEEELEKKKKEYMLEKTLPQIIRKS